MAEPGSGNIGENFYESMSKYKSPIDSSSIFNQADTGAIDNLERILGGDALSNLSIGGGGTDTGSMFGSLFEKDNLLGTIGLGGQLINSLMKYGTLQDQLDLNREKFNFSKGFANRNIANTAKSTNTRLENARRSQILAEGSNNRLGSLSTYMNNNRVDGSPIAA